jgi:hypothetical protein
MRRKHCLGCRSGAALVVLGVVITVMAVMPVALANPHHPLLSASTSCATGQPTLSGSSWSWLQDSSRDGQSGNPDIRIQFRDNGSGPWYDSGAAGAFTAANGYQFDWGPIPWPAGATISLQVRAYAAAPFNNGSSQGVNSWSYTPVTLYAETVCESRIVVDKVTVPPTGDNPDFGFDASWRSSYFYQDDNDTPRDSGPLAPGIYSVSEVDMPPGWAQQSATCSDGSDPSAIDLQAGEVVTCTFTNIPVQGHILVDKVTIPPTGNDPDFGFDASWRSSYFYEDDNDSPRDSGALDPGIYSVSEADVPPGWVQVSATCSDGSDPSAIDLQAGEVVTCTFTNTQWGAIVVAKETLPDGSLETFHFTGAVDSWLYDGVSSAAVAVMPGSYSVTEEAKAGWDLVGISCDDGNSSGDIGAGTATFNVESGEVVTCTFTNRQEGQIIVAKETVPDGSSAVFDFSGDIVASLSDGEASTPVSVDPGAHSVTESLGTGWSLTGISCDDDNSSGDLGTATATFNVEPGEVVTCTFTNTADPAYIIVDKVTDPPGDPTQFEFAPSWGPDFLLADADAPVGSGVLLPGIYSVAELASPGWVLGSATCSDGSDPAAIVLDPGETVTCTFSNFRPPTGSLTIVKEADPDDGTAFSFNGGAFSLEDGGSHVISGVGGSSVVVTEDALSSGWQFSGVTCDAADWSVDGETLTVNVGFDEAAICTFSNYKLGRVVVEKLTLPISAPPQSFDFTSSWDGGFALANGGSRDSGYTLAPGGPYSVSESLPAPTDTDEWVLLSAVCSDGSDTSAISLDPGETVTCVYTNLWTFIGGGATAALTVVKSPTPADNTVFQFNGGALGSFSLQAPSHASQQFLDLEAGAYTITESALAGWDFDHVQCSAQSWSANGASVTVNLAEGEIASCTFYNIAEELPFTGTPWWFLVLLMAGIASTVAGSSLLLASLRRGAAATG